MLRTLPLILLPLSQGTVQLPGWFGDNMVLQDGAVPAFLAGRTDPAGELVAVSGDAGEYSLRSDAASGHWKLRLGPSAQWRNPSNMSIRVAGATGPAASARGVQAGDVIFCSGQVSHRLDLRARVGIPPVLVSPAPPLLQSNMLFSLGQSLNYTAEAATLAEHPNFRFFMTARATNATPQFDFTPQPLSACDANAPAPAPAAADAAAAPPVCDASGFYNDTDFHDGQGLGSAPGSGAADCCAQCGNATWAALGCRFFTLAPDGTCWFKKDSSGKRASKGAISGGVAPPPAPTPPPPPPAPKPCNRWLTAAEAEGAFLLSFSAVCFMTARDVARLAAAVPGAAAHRPVGLVQAAWGGSRVEAWMSAKALASAGPPVAGNVPFIPPTGKSAANHASALFNGMVSPWTNFSIKAALWYQGEQNADQSCQFTNSTCHTQPVGYYAAAYAAMVRDWRDSKGAGDFAIGTMQLPPSVQTGVDPAVTNPLWAGRPDIRAGQGASAAHAGNSTDVSGVAVTIDLGGASNWGYDHPPNKNEMSRRLALQLLHTAFGLGEGEIPLWTGPVLSAAARGPAAGAVSLTFTQASAAGGLSLRDVRAPTSTSVGRGGVANPNNNCTLCCGGGGAPFEVTFDPAPAAVGANGPWTRLARAQIAGGPANAVALSTAGLGPTAAAEPTAVRYAWTDFVDCVLDNGASGGIPAAPFRYFF